MLRCNWGNSWSLLFSDIVLVVDEMASGSIRTQSGGMVGAAQFCFIFWVTNHLTQFMFSVSKLALFTILAFTVFFKWPTQFGFVATGSRLGLLFVPNGGSIKAPSLKARFLIRCSSASDSNPATSTALKRFLVSTSVESLAWLMIWQLDTEEEWRRETGGFEFALGRVEVV